MYPRLSQIPFLTDPLQYRSSSRLALRYTSHLTDLVNTRCVYYHHDPLPAHHKDNMTLAPLIDMINHSPDENVNVSRSENTLEIHAARTIKADEEIFFSYHSSSWRFWVCEYGFWP